MEWILTIILGSYNLLLLALWLSWRKMVRSSLRSVPSNNNFISVIIPARNEKQNLPILLDHLEAQFENSFEIIVVDDHSSDGTRQLVENRMQLPFKNGVKLTCVDLTDGLGKKLAIEAGIKRAKGNIIATLDADCAVGPNWTSSLMERFNDPVVKMVSGMVRIQGQGLWANIQSIEFASLIGTGAATMGWGFPTMCNGANLAYRKDAFEAVGGYKGNEHIASGDDEFLMRKIFSKFPKGVIFNPSMDAVVVTHHQKNLANFVQQRKRWASKWNQHESGESKILAVYIFLFHLSYILSLGMICYKGGLTMLVPWVTAKVMLETIFLSDVLRKMGVRFNWIAYIMLQIVYSSYVVAIGVAIQFSGYTWKERRVVRS